MAKLLWIPIILLLIQAVHSYILLSANIEDIRNIGKRVASSPLVSQVSGIVRRAYDTFNMHLNRARARMRSDDKDIVLTYNPSDQSDKGWRKNRYSRRTGDDHLSDKDRSNKDQTNKDQTNKDQANKDQTNKDEANKDQSNKDQTNKDQANKDQTNKDEANKDQANKDMNPTNNGDQSRRQANNKETKDETFSALGKSASVYLEKIKNIFEKA